MKVAITDLFTEHSDGTIHPVSTLAVDGVLFTPDTSFSRQDFSQFLENMDGPRMMIEVQKGQTGGEIILL